MGRPVVKKIQKRTTSSFLTKGLTEINTEIHEAYGKATRKDIFWAKQAYTKVNKADAEACFMEYKGRCVFCDKTLSYLGRNSENAARLMWYVPLNVGGKARPDNLVVVCAECKHGYRSTRKLREDVQGLDSFADVCVALWGEVVKVEPCQVSIDRLKNRLNIRLVDVATCMRYVVQTEPTPEHDEQEILIEGENTLADLLVEPKKNKDKITNVVRGMVKHGQYRVIRPVPK
jgi:hypothetical protein